MADANSKDSRKENRTSLALFVWYRVLEGLLAPTASPASEAASIDASVSPAEGLARVVDLSARGVGFVTNRPFALGTWLFLEITSKHGNISAVGRVRNCTATGKQNRLGILFEVVPPNHRQVLAAILAP